MPGEGYIKLIAIFYVPPVTRNSIDLTEIPQTDERSQLLPTNVGNLSIPRALTPYTRANLMRIVVDPDFAALTARVVNSHEQRLIRIDIRGWVDYHRMYENAVRFEQYGRLTPRRLP